MRRAWRGIGRSAPLGLLGALVLIGLVERELTRREIPWFTNVWALDWRLSGRTARTEARNAGILCFGDSLVKFGVIPALLEEKTGERTHNFALSCGTPVASHAMLERVLMGGGRPKVVVVDCKSHMVSDRPEESARLLPELVDGRNWIDLTLTSADPVLGAKLLAARLLTSVRSRDEIRETARAFVRGGTPDHVFVQSTARRNWLSNRGAQIMAPNPSDDRPIDATLASSLFPERWSPDPTQAAYLRRFLKLATDSGARVYLTIPPPIPSVRAARVEQGLDAAYDAFLRATLLEFPEVTVFDGRDSGYPDAVHCDAIHLDRDGAAAFTVALADRIVADGETPGRRGQWIAAPAYAPADSSGIEDFEEARLAVRESRGTSR